VADLERELDRLFALPLDEFTGARNGLAKKLRAEQDSEAADLVQRLPKPSVAAWTVNRLSRAARRDVRALLQAGDSLRDAQRRLLAGEDAAVGLREATAAERAAVDRLSVIARALLDEAGRPATQAILDRVAATLRAAAVTDDGRRLLESGRLTEKLEPPGFGELGAPARARSGRRRPAAAKTADRARERREQEELRRRARELEREARAAEREAERAEAGAVEARRRADAAREAAEAAAAAAGPKRL